MTILDVPKTLRIFLENHKRKILIPFLQPATRGSRELCLEGLTGEGEGEASRTRALVVLLRVLEWNLRGVGETIQNSLHLVCSQLCRRLGALCPIHTLVAEKLPASTSPFPGRRLQRSAAGSQTQLSPYSAFS